MERQFVSWMGVRAVGLAMIAGYVDAFSVLHLHVFTSFMSGNTTYSGLHLGESDFTKALPYLLAIPGFVTGAFAGTLVAAMLRAHHLRWTSVLVACLLAAGWASMNIAWFPWLTIVVLTIAMGALNSSVTHVGGQSLGVGYVTGNLTKLGAHLALAIRHVPLENAAGPKDTHWRRAGILLTVWLALLLGAATAAAMLTAFDQTALVCPIVGLLVLAAVSSSKTSTDSN